MRTTIIIAALTLALGCGKKDPVQPSASNTEGTKPNAYPWLTPEKETGKEATQPITPNTRAHKPEAIKAKATAGVKLWEFETGSYVNRNNGEVFGVKVAEDRHETGQTIAFGGGEYVPLPRVSTLVGGGLSGD